MTSPLENKHLSFFDYEHDPAWRVFRIMAEFVQGLTFLSRLEKTVTFFGSARLHEDNPYYQMARTIGYRCAEKGYTVVTGGGPGIMMAGNQGAYEAGGMSVGINIKLPFEEAANPYVKQHEDFHYFFSRKFMLDYSAQAYLFFPGGFGTLDELFTVLTLIQTGKMEPPIPPMVLIGSEFWGGLVSWITQTLRDEFQTISPTDLSLFKIVDDIEEVMRIVTEAEERTVR
ncbi:MAG: TIGR00730 family Rossman fold protein [Ardenticatenales bacterium]|nr:TIGR00730 family Rossman fold protein [Ardenticatenales bacterium]